MAAIKTNASNFFETELTSVMSGTATEANVLTTNGGPPSPCYLVIDPDVPTKREVVYFDGSFTGTKFVVTSLASRYQDGSAGTDIQHDAGAKVISAPVSQMLRDLHDRVDAVLQPGAVILWSGALNSIPSGWALCDGSNGTPDLRGRFVVGASQESGAAGSGSSYNRGSTGGADSVILSTVQMPSHTHSGPSHTHAGPSHTHGVGTLAVSSSTHSHRTWYKHTTSTSHVHDSNQSLASGGPGTNVLAVLGAYVTDSSHSHSISGSTNTGGSTGNTSASGTAATGSTGGQSGEALPHENRPRYYALYYIMRVA